MTYIRTFVLLTLLPFFVQENLLDCIFLVLFAVRGVQNSQLFNYINPMTRQLEDKPHIVTIISTWFGMIIIGINTVLSREMYMGNITWSILFILQYMAFRFDWFMNDVNDTIQQYRNRNISNVLVFGS
jgi:hypothetical protein